MLADLVIVTKSASQEIWWQKWGRGKSAGRFSGCHPNQSVRKYAGRNWVRVNILGYLVTVTTSDSQEMYWQKLGSALNLLADLVTVTKLPVGKSFGRNGRNVLADLVIVAKSAQQEICWQNGGKSAGRFSDCHQICQSKYHL